MVTVCGLNKGSYRSYRLNSNILFYFIYIRSYIVRARLETNGMRYEIAGHIFEVSNLSGMTHLCSFFVRPISV